MLPLRNIHRFFYKATKQPIYALKVFIRRSQGYLYYWFFNGRSSLPEAITLFLTYRCNLRCKMCGQWGEGGITKKQPARYIQQELSLEKLRLLIKDLAKFRPNITLFGGEPLLYSGCLEIIRHIKERQMHCLMITNGSLLEDFALELVESGLDELNLSLDGNLELHNQIRGMPGLFEKIMQGLKILQDYKAKRNSKKPLINLQCTITKYNYLHLEQLLEVASEVKADSLTFHNLIFLDTSVIDRQKDIADILKCNFEDWQGFVFNPDIDPDLLYQKIKSIRAKKLGFDVDFYPNFSNRTLLEYYKNPDYMPSEYLPRCLSPWIVAYIFPDGSVRPCLNCSYSFGNIMDNKFIEIWNSKEAIIYRRQLKDNGIFPVCARCTELYRY
ncbi:MAG: radical SAM protein [Candidatus Omnitrophica bacterium]|nr:radical SAM protein [Candidatus Omnitrophota bacterium]